MLQRVFFAPSLAFDVNRLGRLLLRSLLSGLCLHGCLLNTAELVSWGLGRASLMMAAGDAIFVVSSGFRWGCSCYSSRFSSCLGLKILVAAVIPLWAACYSRFLQYRG